MIEVHEVHAEEELQRCFTIRKEVFVQEQKVPLAEEIDALDRDPNTVHVLLRDGDADLGTARILPDGAGEVHIGRVAVRANARGYGYGRALMEAAHRIAAQKFSEDDGRLRCVLSAQLQAVPFYESLGYRSIDERIYLDAQIEHRDMACEINLCNRDVIH
ncbi:GNAT family N-acetyltransferase [Arcanobacterium bovis]|uniref:GNAT family N-acetyltransferase n=1 Tax=Arcanobacterium bovis TaxID=2529275 RepID=A0A4Q9V110_9ACTO|nr:GNAT family N-acetyltransferase [Arcanobacterium bovis]TBW22770.1 GNAT family N-acetyltransferase [Arcanobacterium bovis]